MDINTLRERSASFSTNSFRVLLAHLDLSSISYYERIEVQSNRLTQNKQVEINERESFSLSYTTSKIGESKQANKAIDYNLKDRK